MAISHLNLLGSNILSIRYHRDKGIIADLEWCCVVASKVNLACSTLIFQTSLKSSGVVLECLSLEMNDGGGINLSSAKGPVDILVGMTDDPMIRALNVCILNICIG